jgi:hypothetical protein
VQRLEFVTEREVNWGFRHRFEVILFGICESTARAANTANYARWKLPVYVAIMPGRLLRDGSNLSVPSGTGSAGARAGSRARGHYRSRC